MCRPCKNTAYSGKISTSEGCAFALVTQIYPFQMLVCSRGSMYFHCAFGMFEKSSKTDAKSTKNRRKIDGKSSKIDPRNSKLALRSVLAGPGRLAEPPKCDKMHPRWRNLRSSWPNKTQHGLQVGFWDPEGPPPWDFMRCRGVGKRGVLAT